VVRAGRPHLPAAPSAAACEAFGRYRTANVEEEKGVGTLPEPSLVHDIFHSPGTAGAVLR